MHGHAVYMWATIMKAAAGDKNVGAHEIATGWRGVFGLFSKQLREKGGAIK